MTKIVTIDCRSWEDFMIRVARNLGAGRVAFGRIYRGQADPSWPVASKFERWLHLKRGKDPQRPIASMFGPSGPEAYEADYLASFQEAAVGTPGLSTDGLKDDDWWVLGRHHGLVTRLLDWTHSPYIAAFFAFVDLARSSIPGFGEGLSDWIPKLESGDVAVWALAPLHCLFDDGEFEYIDRAGTSSIDNEPRWGYSLAYATTFIWTSPRTSKRAARATTSNAFGFRGQRWARRYTISAS